jgi:dTDP-4-amino-4,6-dideoxygalactose transaminase
VAKIPEIGFAIVQVDKYSWVDLGSSYLPSDMLAAFLLAQHEAYDDIQARCRAVWERYDLRLRTLGGRLLHHLYSPEITS